MGPMDVNSQVMQWRPALIRLNLIPRPDVDDGQPTTTYVDPAAISAIWRTNVAKDKPGGGTESAGCYTLIHCHYYNIMVVETPEQVARLRDKALGHEARLTAV